MNNTLQVIAATKQLMEDLTKIATAAAPLVKDVQSLGTVALQHLPAISSQVDAGPELNADLAEAARAVEETAQAFNEALLSFAENGSATRALQNIRDQSDAGSRAGARPGWWK
jgi:hypothetical protein